MTVRNLREHVGVGGAFASAQERSEGGKLLGASLEMSKHSGIRLKVVHERLETRREIDQHITETLL